MQDMDWQTLVARRAKRDPPDKGGWSAFMTSSVSADLLDPIANAWLNAACEKTMFGWPCDKEIESLRDQFMRQTDPAKRKALAEAVQARAAVYGTHIPLGQWYGATAVRTTVTGMIEAPVTVFWNVEKKGR